MSHGSGMPQLRFDDPDSIERTPELRKRMWMARVHPIAVHKDILEDRLAKPKAPPVAVAQVEGLSRTEMGAFVGRYTGGPPYSREAISTWEDVNLRKAREYTRADRKTVEAWAEATGYPIEWLLCETDERPAPSWVLDNRDALIAEVEELRGRVRALQHRLAEAERAAGRRASAILARLEGMLGGAGPPTSGRRKGSRLDATRGSGRELQPRLAEAERVAGRHASEILARREGMLGGAGLPTSESLKGSRLDATWGLGCATYRARALEGRLLLPAGVSPALAQIS